MLNVSFKSTPSDLVVMLLLCTVLTGCASKKEVLHTTVSPDGAYTAQIVRIDTRGPGNHHGETIVKVCARGTDNCRDVAVLIDNMHIPGAPAVAAEWIDKNHLSIKPDTASIGFQAVKLGSVTITYVSQG